MPTLDWNTIRTAATRFAKDWVKAGYEKGETHLFYQAFFQLFGMPLRRFVSLEAPVKKLGNKRGFIDLFWPGVLLVEQKSAGRSLTRAREQALDYFPGLANDELPRYLLLSDFQRFELIDLDAQTEIAFTLEELPHHVEHFAFIRGDEAIIAAKQEAVTIRAAELIGHIHNLLEADGFTGEPLQLFLIRLTFCLFADDTGIFDQNNRFLALLKNRTAKDGSDLGGWLQTLFDTLNTPENQRQKTLGAELTQFPYINGSLFASHTRIPAFDTAMREAIIQACEFNWSAVSPAIFGALFQSVMDSAMRRAQGAHYTGEAHILRVIAPLFLDDLYAEFVHIRGYKKKKQRIDALTEFHKKIAQLRFLDPACGCGNFLVIAYQQLRQLETVLLQELHGTQQNIGDVSHLSHIDVDHFYGIELAEFPARIAQVALWMTDHLANLELSAAFGQYYSRIPLKKSPHIHCADALEVEWHSILPAQQCSYVLGNPPFVGKSYQSAQQSAQIKAITQTAGLKSGGGTLDYVCAWWIKAAHYIQAAKEPPHIAFVSTNSITQGEQVAQLWPLLFQRYGMEISFAHRTFAWESEARGAAHVHVVIIGLSVRGSEPKEKRLFHYDKPNGEPIETRHKMLSPYLFDASKLCNPHVVVRNEKKNLMDYPGLIMGSKPVEGGHYIFTEQEKSDFLTLEPGAKDIFRPFMGAQEFINGSKRWILALQDTEPHHLRALPQVMQRMEAVQKFRLSSKKAPTKKLAQTPMLFEGNVIPETPFLVIPQVSSEKRDYIPMGYLKPPIIPSDKLRIMPDAQLWHFAILTSRMHMAWMRLVTGRMKSDYMYSVGVVYNAFPWPEGLQENKQAQEKLAQLAQAVLDARDQHPNNTLADLYDRTAMPANLRKAHGALDRFVERLYRSHPFDDDAERVAHLLGCYERLLE